MTFLEMVQRLRMETGIAETGPSSVQGQTRDYQRLVNWVNDGWLRVQSSRPNWRFMWRSADTTLYAGASTVVLEPDVDDIRIILVDGNELAFEEYSEFLENFPSLGSGRPGVYTIRPDDALLLNTLSNADYPFYYEYYTKPALMVENFDAPTMPEKFHMLLVWYGLMQYALFDEAPELARKAEINYNQLFSELERDELWDMDLGVSLV